MSLEVGVGASMHPASRRAGRVAARAALKQLGCGECDFVMVFATARYDQEVLIRTVRGVTGEAPLTGCSAESVLCEGKWSESRHAVVVIALKSDSLKFVHTIARGTSQEIGESLARSLPLTDDPVGVLAFADGLAVSYDELRRGFESAAAASVPILGALAADHTRLLHTFQYHDDEVITGGASAVLISGPASLAAEIAYGYAPVGLPLTVTRSDETTLYKLDDRPILDLLEEYLGPEGVREPILDLSLGIPAKPGDTPDSEPFALRFLHSPDAAARSLKASTAIAEGQKVWLMIRDRRKVLGRLEEAGERLRRRLDGRPPRLLICFECAAGTGLAFADSQRAGWLQRLIGIDAPTAGFRAYGEIAPTSAGNRLHNNSITLAVLY